MIFFVQCGVFCGIEQYYFACCMFFYARVAISVRLLVGIPESSIFACQPLRRMIYHIPRKYPYCLMDVLRQFFCSALLILILQLYGNQGIFWPVGHRKMIGHNPDISSPGLRFFGLYLHILSIASYQYFQKRSFHSFYICAEIWDCQTKQLTSQSSAFASASAFLRVIFPISDEAFSYRCI